jgi:hypothetical protein
LLKRGSGFRHPDSFSPIEDPGVTSAVAVGWDFPSLSTLELLIRHFTHRGQTILLHTQIGAILSATPLLTWRHQYPLHTELNPICHLLALLGAHHIFHISRKRIKCLWIISFVDAQKFAARLHQTLSAPASKIFVHRVCVGL